MARSWMWPPFLTGQSSAPGHAPRRVIQASMASRPPRGIDNAFLSALAVVDRNRALVVVVEQQRYRLAAPQPTAVEQGEHGGVASTDRRVATGAEQRSDFTHIDVAASRQHGSLDVGHVARARQGLGVNLPEAPGFLERTADGCQHVVDGGRLGAFLDEDRAQRGDMLVANLGPVHRHGILGTSTGKQFSGSIQGSLQAAATGSGWLAGQVDRGRIAVEAFWCSDDGHDGRRKGHHAAPRLLLGLGRFGSIRSWMIPNNAWSRWSRTAMQASSMCQKVQPSNRSRAYAR